jgi:hypothetical protein
MLAACCVSLRDPLRAILFVWFGVGSHDRPHSALPTEFANSIAESDECVWRKISNHDALRSLPKERAQIRSRPQKRIYFRGDDPLRQIVETNPSTRRWRQLNRIAGINRPGMCDRRNNHPALFTREFAHKHDDGGACLSPFLQTRFLL